ncbi:MAG: S41 family peptidase, partial [Acidobacteria bacterium]|nr:S41 family peptidase [Acidobacteriota bacterium]
GGGITPDAEVLSPELNAFQQELGRKLVFYPYDPGVGDFAKRYLAQHSDVPKDFEVTPEVMDEFRRFLNEKNIRYTETDIQDSLEWIKLKIKKEIFTSVFGRDEAARVALLADPQVQRGVELLPEAKALRENLRRTIARQPQKQ